MEPSDQRVTGRVFLTRLESDQRDVITTTDTGHTAHAHTSLSAIYNGSPLSHASVPLLLLPSGDPGLFATPDHMPFWPRPRAPKSLFPRYSDSFVHGHGLSSLTRKPRCGGSSSRSASTYPLPYQITTLLACSVVLV